MRKDANTPTTFSDRATMAIGSTASLIIHTIIFIGAFVLILFGANADRVLLVLTTIVSLEAIYLAIFIQITVNRHTADIAEIAEDVEDIAEDVEEIERDIDEIQEDVEHIEHDIDEIAEDVDELNEEDEIDLTIHKVRADQSESNGRMLIELTQEIRNLRAELQSMKNNEGN